MEEGTKETEIICPNCGSSISMYKYMGKKMIGRGVLGMAVPIFGALALGKDLLDLAQDKSKFECNKCGHTFRLEDYYKLILKREEKLAKLKSRGLLFSSPDNSIIPLRDRQFIMLAKKSNQLIHYYDFDGNIKYFFALDNLPSDLKFGSQFNDPQANVLYMVNPIQTDTYLPFEEAEDILFQSKVLEFEELVSCLGATSIRFRRKKGKQFFSERDDNKKIGGGCDTPDKGGSLELGLGKNENHGTSSSTEIGRDKRFNPTKYPYLPQNLSWYNYEESWQKCVRQRLDNGLTYYRYTFRSSDCSKVSTQKKRDISASFKKMVVSINAHYSQNIKESIEVQEETEWEVEVDFKPLEEFANQSDNAKKSGFVEIPVSNVTLNDNEQFYYDELQDVLADGVITENDRKRLERRRQRLNISEERAKEIEQMLSPSLTDDEQEYYDELFEVLDDGVIDNKERRSLDRLKRSLGISDSRAKEIEDMAFAKRGLK